MREFLQMQIMIARLFFFKAVNNTLNKAEKQIIELKENPRKFS